MSEKYLTSEKDTLDFEDDDLKQVDEISAEKLLFKYSEEKNQKSKSNIIFSTPSSIDDDIDIEEKPLPRKDPLAGKTSSSALLENITRSHLSTDNEEPKVNEFDDGSNLDPIKSSSCSNKKSDDFDDEFDWDKPLISTVEKTDNEPKIKKFGPSKKQKVKETEVLQKKVEAIMEKREDERLKISKILESKSKKSNDFDEFLEKSKKKEKKEEIHIKKQPEENKEIKKPIQIPKEIKEIKKQQSDESNIKNEKKQSNQPEPVEKTENKDIELTTKIDMVTKEWENVEKISEQHKIEAKQVSGLIPSSEIKIRYNEAIEEYLNMNLDSYSKNIQIYDFRYVNFFFSCLYAIFGKPTFKNQTLSKQRDLFFTLANYPLLNEDTLSNRILMTIYMRISGSKISCPRFGSHWEEIGFQGNDPATDLRGQGVLGLIQLLYFLETFPNLSQKIYKLSKDNIQNFPMALVSLQLTNIAMIVLRSCSIYKFCERRNSLFEICNEIHSSLFSKFYEHWSSNHCTIVDFQPLIATLRTQTINNTDSFLLHYQNILSSEKGNVIDDKELEYDNIMATESEAMDKLEEMIGQEKESGTNTILPIVIFFLVFTILITGYIIWANRRLAEEEKKKPVKKISKKKQAKLAQKGK